MKKYEKRVKERKRDTKKKKEKKASSINGRS